MDVWKSIPGFDQYEASNVGLVRSWKSPNGKTDVAETPKILKPYHNSLGYHSYVVRVAGEHRRLMGHRAVLLAFVGEPPDGMECRHLDGNPSNNNLSNLKWGTKKENAEDRERHGTNRFGSMIYNAVLNEGIVRIIKDMLKLGFMQCEIAEIMRVDFRRVSAIKMGKVWVRV